VRVAIATEVAPQAVRHIAILHNEYMLPRSDRVFTLSLG